MFLVLRGDLRSQIILKQSESGQLSLQRFYTRRVLRIWPLYYLLVALSLLLGQLASSLPEFGNAHCDYLKVCLFLANFDVIEGCRQFQQFPSTILIVLWSVAIEEQFYLVYPIVLKLASRRVAGWLIGLTCLVSVAFRY